MTLADTSVWVDHLRREGHPLAALLDEDLVLCHPFVVGELACGSLSHRDRILGLLDALPRARVADRGRAPRAPARATGASRPSQVLEHQATGPFQRGIRRSMNRLNARSAPRTLTEIRAPGGSGRSYTSR